MSEPCKLGLFVGKLEPLLLAEHHLEYVTARFRSYNCSMDNYFRYGCSNSVSARIEG